MKNLTMCCSILLAFGVLFSAAVTTQAQNPELNIGKLGKRIIVPRDKDFEPQKFTPVSRLTRDIAYEVWITTDGVLHCRTSLSLKTASIKFTWKSSSTDAKGVTTGAAGSMESKFNLNKPEGSDAYLFDISPNQYKYKEKNTITLMITSTSGSKAEVTLTNKKLAA